MKTKVLVLGGGKSTEHSVSLVSAYNIFHNIPTEFYTPLLVAIDKKGIWRHCEDLILEVGDISKVCINPEAKEISIENFIRSLEFVFLLKLEEKFTLLNLLISCDKRYLVLYKDKLQ